MTSIRVLVVDDSATVRYRLIEILVRDPDIVIAGEAADGSRAIELCIALRPDVVTLDLVLPERNGLEVTEHIMAHAPTPILVVSGAVNRGSLFDTYTALAAGAVDVLDKDSETDPRWEARFVAAVRMASRIKVITHPRARLGSYGRRPTPSPDVPRDAADPREVELAGIGASTGGPTALVTLLRAIPASFTAPIAVVLHIDDAFARSFGEWFGTQIRRPVRTVRDGEWLDELGAIVVLPPAGGHLVVDERRLRVSFAPQRNHCRPSIDVLFESMATHLGARSATCLLTGMGRDGASGMLAVRRAGGVTIAQDEATSVVWGMPREAVALGGAEHVLPLELIGGSLARYVRAKGMR